MKHREKERDGNEIKGEGGIGGEGREEIRNTESDGGRGSYM